MICCFYIRGVDFVPFYEFAIIFGNVPTVWYFVLYLVIVIAYVAIS